MEATSEQNSPEVYDPNRRQHYRFRHEGENLIVEIRIAPGGDVPTHLHTRQKERWTVLEGRVRFKIGTRSRVPEPGSSLSVGPGIKHSFKNVGAGEARVRAEVCPGLRLQQFLEDGAALSRAGYYTRRGIVKSPRGLVKMAEFIDHYDDELIVTFPPPLIQRALIALLVRRGQEPSEHNGRLP